VPSHPWKARVPFSFLGWRPSDQRSTETDWLEPGAPETDWQF